MNIRTSLRFLFWLTLSFLFCASLLAQGPAASSSRAAAVLDSMPNAKRIGEVSLSPDGAFVAYVVDGKLT
ncbi:MAG: hypothetical protein WCC95_04050, partial [Candidatus Sulfotelmatobacter sp.]